MVQSEKIKKIKAQLGRCTMQELMDISKYIQKRKDKLLMESIKQKDQKHIVRMKSLPIGTKVIIKYGRKATSIGKIVKHGRKYVKVNLSDKYTYWQFPYKYIDDRIDDPLVKSEASVNQGFTALFNGGGE